MGRCIFLACSALGQYGEAPKHKGNAPALLGLHRAVSLLARSGWGLQHRPRHIWQQLSRRGRKLVACARPRRRHGCAREAASVGSGTASCQPAQHLLPRLLAQRDLSARCLLLLQQRVGCLLWAAAPGASLGRSTAGSHRRQVAGGISRHGEAALLAAGAERLEHPLGGHDADACMGQGWAGE